MRFAFAVLCSCVLVALSVPATAGDYYGNGYRHRHGGSVWYSSSCCYKKIVRHERSVRYVRVDEGRPYYRNGYHDRPYRNGYYHDRPYRSSYYYGSPRRYVSDGYYDNGNGGYYNGNGRYYSSGYDAGYDSYAQSCTWRKARIADGRGGWVWGGKRVCY